MEHGGRRSLQGPIRRQYEDQGHPYCATAPVGRRRDRPTDTARVLALGLAATLNAPIPEDTKFGLFRM